MVDAKLREDSAAARLRYARELTGLSRTLFCKKYDLSHSSLAQWEQGVKNFSKNAAKRIAECLLERGVQVAPEWLLTGEGPEPTTMDLKVFQSDNLGKLSFVDEEQLIWREASAFKNYYKESLTLHINDDTAYPHYVPGDFVGGKIISENELPLYENKPLLVKCEGVIKLRIVEQGSKPGLYTLTCLNQSTLWDKPILKNIKIEQVAPIIWFRRKAPNKKR